MSQPKDDPQQCKAGCGDRTTAGVCGPCVERLRAFLARRLRPAKYRPGKAWQGWVRRGRVRSAR